MVLSVSETHYNQKRSETLLCAHSLSGTQRPVPANPFEAAKRKAKESILSRQRRNILKKTPQAQEKKTKTNHAVRTDLSSSVLFSSLAKLLLTLISG